ncbi:MULTISPECIES: GNAT family N-acetyltransferase [unclassified Brevundimonas]|jgi:predicted N-acetyltransferase YhbS|uniref:GNAT family N-acetyltransferase n=1 Tax=unclassified Brevundimonas TaxID=2622653 RepID=UPI000CFCC934|nr:MULTISPECIES: N-acetyltransferase [unclassified Brevundimonas]PRA22372.1 GNAT family N-acetyltransferase [Brevundimonas sp. MYb27]PQZ74069.1 GNAT family N-acetyltransferase [Brevundimonas sp. MYb31]PRB10800.1 GNAT family N-acetyltransferase [Brevundimonas sp. MYb52]PRB32411.1 GNAT family N-acetyltransferase [Brevundimonas sp. MYb46]PRB50287.1 GNAT family N-acetyltransferase [Brevundimonas sp. MYb33]
MNAVAAPTAVETVTPVRILRERSGDAAAIDALVLAAFGPGRFAKTAERLREAAALAVGFCAFDGERLIGSVRLWSISVGAARSVFLGPIAVDAASRRGGLGADLVQACIEEARAMKLDGVLLVGDPPYFSRFGFLPAPGAVLSGPVDRRRVMWLPITDVVPVGAVRPVA